MATAFGGKAKGRQPHATEHRRGGVGKMELEMWKCGRCGGNTFASRTFCFGCGAPRPHRPHRVMEYWWPQYVPVDVQTVLAQRGSGRQRREEMPEEEGATSGGGHEGESDMEEHGPTGRMVVEGSGGKGVRGAGGKGGKRAARPVGFVGSRPGGEADLSRSGTLAGAGKGGGAHTGEPNGGDGARANEGGYRRQEIGGMELDRSEAEGIQGIVQTGRPTEMAELEVVPATQAKAKAGKPVRKAAQEPEEGAEAWPTVPPPWRPPPLSRADLAGRLEALESRAKELPPGDPRIEKAQARIAETEMWVKAAGGRSPNKLPFSMVDCKKEMERSTRGEQEAEKELEEAKRREVEAHVEVERAEASLRAWRARKENARAKKAHVGFQIAIEAAAGMGGYDELVDKVNFVAWSLVKAGLAEAKQAQDHIAWFISQFRKAEYAKEHDPYWQELASSAASTVRVGGGEEQEGDMEQDEPRINTQPKAFETAISTAMVGRMALAEERKEALPIAWRIDTDPVENRPEADGSTKEGRGLESKKPQKRSKSVVRGKIGKDRGRRQNEAVEGGEKEKGMEVDGEGGERRSKGDEEQKEDRGKSSKAKGKRDRRRGSRSSSEGSPRDRSRERSRIRRSRSRTADGEEKERVGGKEKGGNKGRGQSGSWERCEGRGGDIAKDGAEEDGGSRPSGETSRRRSRWEPSGEKEKDEGKEEEKGYDHCLACGDGPFLDSRLQNRCECGGPI